jgi:hypothetical protein
MGNPDYKIEINELMLQVEKKFGRRLNVSNGFEEFALLLSNKLKSQVSASTLKRLYGYVGDVHTPRMSTLDILAQYIGHIDFLDFCQWLRRENPCSSQFFSASELSISSLSLYDEVEIGWLPNRYVRLLYRGDASFEVVEVRESQLQVGDILEVSSFILGEPLYFPYILRSGERTSSFVVGKNGGLTLLNKVSR